MGSCDQSLLVEEFECGSSHLRIAEDCKGSVDIGERLCGSAQSGLAEVGEGCSGDCLSVHPGATDIDPSSTKFREDSEAGNIDFLAQEEVSHTECGEDVVCLHGGSVESEGPCLENRCCLDVSEITLTLSPLTGLRSSCGEADEQRHMEIAGNCAHRDEGNDKNCVSYGFAERGSEVVHEKREIDSCTCNRVQQNDSDINKVSDGSAVRVMERKEDKDDLLIGSEVEPHVNRSPVEENSSNIKECSWNIAFDLDVDNSVIPDACPLVSISTNETSKRLDISDCSGVGDVIAGPNLSILTDGLEQKDSETNEGTNNIVFDGYLGVKSSNYKCQSFRRSMHLSKSKRATKKEKVPKKIRKTVNKGPYSHENIEIFSVTSRRKRSCPYKSRRSSNWGSLGNILDIFEQNNQHVVNKVIEHCSYKEQNLKVGKQIKCNGNQEGRSSPAAPGLKGKSQPVTGRIRLKIKMGKKGDQSSIKMLTSEPKCNPAPDHGVIGIYGHGVLKDILGKEVPMIRSFQCMKKQPESAELQPDTSYPDEHLKDQSLESTINLYKSSRNSAGDIELEVAGMGDVTENRHIDPGTSPDSEVINQIPDARVGLQVQQSAHDDPMTSSSGIVFPGDVMQFNLPRVSKKKGTKKGKISGSDDCTKNPLFANGSLSNGLSKKHGMKKNIADELNSDETSENIEKVIPSLKLKGKMSSKSSKSRAAVKFKSDETDIIGSRRENVCVQKDVQRKSVNKSNNEKDINVEDNPGIGNPVVDDCGTTNMSDKSGSEEKFNLDMVQSEVMESYIKPRNAWVSCDECQKWRRIPATLADSIEETNSKWTCMDNMDKAFANCSTPQEKSNSEINAELEISDAEDATTAGFNNSKGLEQRHPAVSQPSSWTLIKSNIFKHRKRKTQTIDEIMVCYCTQRSLGRPGCGDACLNRMLNIECVRGTCPCGDSCSNQQFQKHNYAKLKSFRCGKKGYGLQLLEDISKGQFLIEYVGEVLDMHAYEARQVEYASRGHTHFYFMTLNGSEVIDACAKGNLGRFINHSCDPNCRTEKWMVNGEICIGLFAIRDIKKGEELTFDYNYVRVVGAAAKKCVCGSSQCRGYIGGDPLSTEVIVQGDSDDEYPEPVMVLENGETVNSFDRLVPKANSYRNEEMQTGEASKGRISIVECAGAVGQLEITLENEDSTQRSASAGPHIQISSNCMGPIGIIPSSNQPVRCSLEIEEVTNNPIPIAGQDITEKQEAINKSTCSPKLEAPLTSTLDKSISSSYDDDSKMSQLDMVEGKSVFSKSIPMIKKSKSSRSVKKGKHKTNMVTANKSQLTPNKPKKVMQETDTGRNETVEEKLNELLDADGGISKQKDASKGYLKLLLLTAASGDSVNGEAIQSNRDLSIILEVLLKTKSRMVLVDIINKNGLRMLHNIIKQSRKEYNKTPILRKLLKVLEYLATKEILTLEHINVGPPCPGMESFRQSILALTEHSNKQVHQIARNFRDRWIRRSSGKQGCNERGDGRKEKYKGSNCNRLVSSYTQDHGVRGAEATESTTQSLVAAPSAGTPEEGSLRSGGDGSIHTTKIRKRKSRWDEPAQTSTDLVSPPCKEQKFQPSKSISLLESCRVVQNNDSNLNHTLQDASDIAKGCGQTMHEDVPPGFSFPLNTQLVSPQSNIDLPEESGSHSTTTFETVIGHPQERFRSWLPVSYGIPLSLFQQNEIPESASVDGWTIAPGIVFHPFPPLPSYPPNGRNSASCSIKSLNGNDAGDVQRGSCGSATYHMDHNSPSTSSTGVGDGNAAGTNNQHMFDRARANSVDLGKRFRQQKWNNNKLAPPWARRSKWDQTESTPRNGMCNIDVDSVQNEHKNPYHSVNFSRIQPGGNTFYRQPQHQNQH